MNSSMLCVKTRVTISCVPANGASDPIESIESDMYLVMVQCDV